MCRDCRVQEGGEERQGEFCSAMQYRGDRVPTLTREGASGPTKGGGVGVKNSAGHVRPGVPGLYPTDNASDQ